MLDHDVANGTKKRQIVRSAWISGLSICVIGLIISFNNCSGVNLANFTSATGYESAGLTGLAGTVKLAWDANTESDLSHYNIYYGLSADNLDMSVTTSGTNSETDPAFDVINLELGKTYWFAVTAVDTSDNESGKSSAVSTEVK